MGLAAAPTRPFEQLMLDFLAYLEFERGLSRNTLEAYRGDLQQFGAFLAERGTDARAVDHTQLAAFLAALAVGSQQRPPASAATLQRKAACLRSFYRHLRREGMIAHDPTAELRGPRKVQKLPAVLSRDEVGRLLGAPRARRSSSEMSRSSSCKSTASEARSPQA